MEHETDKLFYLKYMEIACDRSNEKTYILEDLNLLAEVLEEMEMTYIIKTIEMFDLHSTHSIVDMNLGMSAEGLSTFGVGETELLRNIDGNNVFLFWNHEVKLDEVMNWVIELSKELHK